MRRFVVALLLLAGCSRHSSQRVYVQPHYAQDASGLRALWRDILDAAKNDDRDRVHDLLATTLLSDADMKRLFGAKADALLPRYHQLMGNLINRGAVELVANVYEHKYDAVDAFAAEDPALAAALVEPHPLFAARVRKAIGHPRAALRRLLHARRQVEDAQPARQVHRRRAGGTDTAARAEAPD